MSSVSIPVVCSRIIVLIVFSVKSFRPQITELFSNHISLRNDYLIVDLKYNSLPLIEIEGSRETLL